mmetsp:Transcript_39400/g.47798  ORF Transcript_39400/g.47798 Transcript_39400/m.47798 type:complete len:107 (-) Transcript_39400:196-516(-)|eukprot:CAMPEP_0197851914 /NCGR_PEP_ID=MMETSP1438-20131217/19238_1 /TAXON_ID=1461541 /ORGANISM="Pterosperma sp., Strain CCMP1384" /LENGTH=106 /DNA_ID=CAMNT_0043465715 /DNA_START=105 /DNA_END=425 /DNA_ORIENTATION=+
MAAKEALSLYRGLMRVCRKTFAGDQATYSAALLELRNKYRESLYETDPQAIEARLAEGREVIEFMGGHVVQGALNDQGNYAIKLEKHHGDMVMSMEEDGECSSKSK